MKHTLAPGVTINTTCLRKDHRWVPDRRNVAYQACPRRGCNATRLNPLMERRLDQAWGEFRARRGL